MQNVSKMHARTQDTYTHNNMVSVEKDFMSGTCAYGRINHDVLGVNPLSLIHSVTSSHSPRVPLPRSPSPLLYHLTANDLPDFRGGQVNQLRQVGRGRDGGGGHRRRRRAHAPPPPLPPPPRLECPPSRLQMPAPSHSREPRLHSPGERIIFSTDGVSAAKHG